MALTRKVDQRVVSSSDKFPGLGTIIKVNPKNVRVRMDSGRVVNFAPVFLDDAPADESTVSPYAAAVTMIEYRPPLNPGEVVTVKGLDGFFVVLKDNVEKASVAKLGGDDGRRYPSVPRSLISDPIEINHTAIANQV